MTHIAPDDAGMTDDQIRQARRLCFFAHYHPRAIVADYVLVYLRELARAGFTVVVLSTAALAASESARLRDACAMLIERENVGLDFGGWIEAFRRFSPIEAELLLLANDSVYGPLHDLSAFIDRLTAVPADFYGAVESWEGGPHLQSWFLLLRPAAYRSNAFRELMSEAIPASLPKVEIIRRYEMALMSTLTAAGLRAHAAYSPREGGEIGRVLVYNPSHLLWKVLPTRYRIPFVKIELLRDNPLNITGLSGWRRLVGRSAPQLVPMIEADLPTRDARPMASLARQFARSVDDGIISYWSELQPLIVGDAISTSRLAQRLRRGIFTLGVGSGRWGRRLARKARRLVRRTPPPQPYAEPHPRPYAGPSHCIAVPFAEVPDVSDALPRRAVVAHVFHVDLAAEFRRYFANIPGSVDLYLSTDSDSKAAEIERVFAGWDRGTVTTRVVLNVGRDMAPKFVTFANVYQRYDAVLCVHSKKSTYLATGQDWRATLLETLCGSEATVSSILRILADGEGVGLAFPDHYADIADRLSWGGNRAMAGALAERAGIPLDSATALEFVSGSMFWARPAALAPLLSLGLRYDDFPPEAGQLDATLAHALERLLLFSTEASRLDWIKIADRRFAADPSRIVEVVDIDALPAAIRSCRIRLLPR